MTANSSIKLRKGMRVINSENLLHGEFLKLVSGSFVSVRWDGHEEPSTVSVWDLQEEPSSTKRISDIALVEQLSDGEAVYPAAKERYEVYRIAGVSDDKAADCGRLGVVCLERKGDEIYAHTLFGAFCIAGKNARYAIQLV